MVNKKIIASEDYKISQRKLHDSDEAYGRASIYCADKVSMLMKENGFSTITDYGAGKKRLSQELKKYGVNNIDYRPYDIAYPEYGDPKKSEMVVCIDVLEHIEFDYLENVLLELSFICEKLIYLSVHTGPAKKTLPDGRNAHLVTEEADWWYYKIKKYFIITHMSATSTGVEFIGINNGYKQKDLRTILKPKLNKSKLSNLRRYLYI